MFEKKIKISMTICVMGKVLLHALLCGSKKKATCVQGLCVIYILLARFLDTCLFLFAAA